MTCTVCAESFNKCVHKKVVCPHCHFEAGRSCIEKYFHTIVNDYRCMNCHKVWDDEFIKNEMTQASVNRLKNHRENVLYDREKSFMPETQPYVVRENYIEKEKELRGSLSKVCNMLYWTKKAKREMEEHDVICEKLKNTIEEAEIIRNDLNLKLKEHKKNEPPRLQSSPVTNKQGYLSDVVLPCPVNDCRGYVNSKWKCGICNTDICNKCHEPKNEDHECTQVNLESAKLVRETTKPCPKCATRIHRISGCTQMWCTQCCTSFDYRTGEIYTKNIHNPHYFEWLQRNPGNADQGNPAVQCGDALTAHQIYTRIMQNTNAGEYRDDMLRFTRHHFHLRYLMRDYPYVPQENPFNQNRTLRIAWMRNKLTDTEFKQKLQQHEKKINLNILKRQTLHMCTQVTQELCFRLYTGLQDKTVNWDEIKNEFKSIINYTDECFAKMYKSYKCQMPNVRL